MNIFCVDVDRTLVPFTGTTRLYKRIFLDRFRLNYAAYGLVMLGLMHGLWFWRAAVKLQRRIVMTLLNRAGDERLAAECARLVEEMIPAYHQGFENRLLPLKEDGDRVYLLSHCPSEIAQPLVERLGFHGEYSLPIGNYFVNGRREIFNKEDVLHELKAEFPDARVVFFADDLVDLPCLRQADRGYLVNPSPFTRWYCERFARGIEIWG